MAISHNTSANLGSASGNISSTNLTIAAVSDSILFIGGRIQGASNIVTNVTWNGSALTQISGGAANPGGSYTYLFYLINPATGNNTAAITVSDQSKANEAVASVYDGAKQSAQPDSSNTATASNATSLTGSTTVVASNCWLVSVIGTQDGIGGNPTAGTGTTRRNQSGNCSIGDSNGTVSTGSQSMSWNISPQAGAARRGR